MTKAYVLLCLVASAASFVSSTPDDPRSGSYLVRRISLAIQRGNAASVMEIPSTVSTDVGHQQLDIIPDRLLKNGNPELPDVIHFESQHVDLCGPILCISANLTNGFITGFTAYEVLKLDFNSDGARVAIDIDMFLPSLQLDAEYYEMEGHIMHALPLSGKGKLQLETTDLRFWTKIILQVSDGTSIETFENSGFSIKSIVSRTEFDGNIDTIFNAMMNELMAEWLNRFNGAIAATCGTVLKDIINPIL